MTTTTMLDFPLNPTISQEEEEMQNSAELKLQC